MSQTQAPHFQINTLPCSMTNLTILSCLTMVTCLMTMSSCLMTTVMRRCWENLVSFFFFFFLKPIGAPPPPGGVSSAWTLGSSWNLEIYVLLFFFFFLCAHFFFLLLVGFFIISELLWQRKRHSTCPYVLWQIFFLPNTSLPRWLPSIATSDTNPARTHVLWRWAGN